jgi:hypothetical protein
VNEYLIEMEKFGEKAYWRISQSGFTCNPRCATVLFIRSHAEAIATQLAQEENTTGVKVVSKFW